MMVRVGWVLPLAACLTMVWTSPLTAADRKNNNYYSFVDDDGVLHITNVRRTEGAWKLYKSLPGSHGNAPGQRRPAREHPPIASGSERFHRYDTLIRGASRRYQLPESLIRAVIHTESNYNPRAVSPVGAMGLMQLMPSTARYLGVSQPFDPRQNIYGGAKFLRILANAFNGDMVLVAAAYNAGAGWVRKHRGVPPFAETRAYVKSVFRRYYAYERQAQLGALAVRRPPARHIAR